MQARVAPALRFDCPPSIVRLAPIPESARPQAPISLVRALDSQCPSSCRAQLQGSGPSSPSSLRSWGYLAGCQMPWD